MRSWSLPLLIAHRGWCDWITLIIERRTFAPCWPYGSFGCQRADHPPIGAQARRDVGPGRVQRAVTASNVGGGPAAAAGAEHAVLAGGRRGAGVSSRGPD